MKKLWLVMLLSLAGCSVLMPNKKPFMDENSGVMNEEVETELPEASVPPESWQIYQDQVYGYTLWYPADWEVSPTPSQGVGGVATMIGEHLGEQYKIEIGRHLLELLPGEDLESYEARRSVDQTVNVLNEEVKELGNREYLAKEVELSAGNTDKKIGLYYTTIVGDRVFFVEAYVSDAVLQKQFLEQILGSLDFGS